MSQDVVKFPPEMTLADIEKAVILQTMIRTGHNRTKAARVLDVGLRTLQRKLKEWKINETLESI